MTEYGYDRHFFRSMCRSADGLLGRRQADARCGRSVGIYGRLLNPRNLTHIGFWLMRNRKIASALPFFQPLTAASRISYTRQLYALYDT